MLINRLMVGAALAPLTGVADDDMLSERFKNTDPNDEKEIKSIIREFLIPFFEKNYSDEGILLIKHSLCFFLSTDKINWMREYDSCLLPFDPPDTPKLFFIWLWEVLFPSECYQINPSENYSVLDDYDELQTLFK